MGHIYISGIQKDSICNGDSFRDVCYISGCWWNCYMCQNKQTHDPTYGDKRNIEDLIVELGESDNDITISGGDCLTYQLESAYKLIKGLKERYNKNIWVYTGYKFSDLIIDNNEIRRKILNYMDVCVDGKFNYDNRIKNPNVKFRGDDSQRIVDVQKSLREGKVITWGKE